MTQDVQIRLQNEVVYVEGYVNNALTEWQKVDNNIWQSTAEKAVDNIYHIFIRAFGSNGLIGEAETVLYFGINLIWDRNQSDLENNNSKAFYNFMDANRVETATEYIANLLKQYSYLSEDLTFIKDWKRKEKMNVTNCRRYLSNINKLVECFCVKSDTPSLPPNLKKLDIEKANNIEKVLRDLYELIQNMIAGFIYSNEVYAGEVNNE